MHLNQGKANNAKPFLMWAGGKRWLVGNHQHLFPTTFNRYIEPFLGAGSVFFHLCPQQGLLGDANADLINTYASIRDDWMGVETLMKIHHENHCKEYYYQQRSLNPADSTERAARFLYLNRTCWNGLYRVNLKGQFNVPIGTKTQVLHDSDDFKSIANALRGMELVSSDFEALIDQADEGDFVFADPPYTVRHNNNAFVKYNENLFSWEDQVRLHGALLRAQEHGAIVFSTNACHQCIQELYKDDFNLNVISRYSSISGASKSRKAYEEYLITTKKVKGRVT